jgi:S-DNA-T family DNA segregation ATPase FtsK/SpoIIIE
VIVTSLTALFGRIGAGVVLGGAGLAFLAAVGIPVLAPLGRFRSPIESAFRATASKLESWALAVRDAFAVDSRDDEEYDDEYEDEYEDEDEEEEDGTPSVRVVPPTRRPRREKPPVLDDPDPPVPEEPLVLASGRPEPSDVGSTDIPANVPVVVLPSRGEPKPPKIEPAETPVALIRDVQVDPDEPYESPPEDFLEREEEEEGDQQARDELVAGARVLEQALHSFGVRGKVTEVQPGPVITRFEIEPAAGQKVAPIASLADDLALALRARSIRVVAPIPGKAAVGIEVPNSNPKVVRLGSLLESPEYRDDPSPLNIALGRSINGEPMCAALDRMPHLLVAGATGAGKSVCINTIITSLIYRAGPQDVRFVMVDPKMLELMTYVGLPHLIPPVVTQPKEASKILKWAVGEMEARYRTLAHVGVRSIADYNKRQMSEGAPKLPDLVVIVDELADLMLSNVKSEIEESTARLAQMARAVGIHLVVATQRPSVDVITGVIKANFPSRIAFQVPTRTDSRTILDSIGAERLLGRGDMLYLGVGMSEPVRIHGSYISTEETTDIVEWLKTRNPVSSVPEDVASPLDEGNDLFPMEREDDLFDEAARILVAHQQGSISLLQRRLKVGYARAARLVDMMEEAEIVGPFEGSKAREIFIPTLEDLEKKLASMKQTPLGGRPTG